MSGNSNFLQFALDTSKVAGKIQLKYFGNLTTVNSKTSAIDLLTKADTESEDFIISTIKKTYPNHNIISEESGTIDHKDNYTWVIDPLDGTTNFSHNLPIFAVSIALKKNDKTICGVVYNPAADKCFYSELNHGAYLNNQRIGVSKSSSLKESLLATGFPYLHDKKYDLSFNLFKEFYDNTRGVRRLGAAALDLCFVAMGRFDGFYEFNLNEWDISAGALIASEAGARVSDWDGKELPVDGTRILCTNRKIHSDMIKILTKNSYDIFY